MDSGRQTECFSEFQEFILSLSFVGKYLEYWTHFEAGYYMTWLSAHSVYVAALPWYLV